jgi:hypothetical protein
VVLVPEPFIIGAMKRDVGAELEVEITAPTELEFQIAVAPHPNTEVSERLSFALDENPVQPLEIRGVHVNRIHKLDAPVGNLIVDYAATIIGRTDPAKSRHTPARQSRSWWRRNIHVGSVDGFEP